jgi:hypothetical protein
VKFFLWLTGIIIALLLLGPFAIPAIGLVLLLMLLT